MFTAYVDANYLTLSNYACFIAYVDDNNYTVLTTCFNTLIQALNIDDPDIIENENETRTWKKRDTLPATSSMQRLMTS